MKVLILSCNTGEGHNAAGRAVKDYLEYKGHQVTMLDFMMLAGKRTSRIVGGAYVKTARDIPHFFGFIYKLGGLLSSSKRKSPVYYANAMMAKHLKRYLQEHEADVIVMPHLYPAETITYMKRKGMLDIKTVAIATDYTCIPFWEETECDYYILPHEDLMEENEERGMDRARMYPYGIPVGKSFTEKCAKNAAKERLKLPKDKPMYLVMSGSMGFGKIHLFAYELARKCKDGESIVIICGNNDKMKRTLKNMFKSKENVHVVGFTSHVSQYMDACDVVYTKPGGLTSTEALVKNIPIVHTVPIPGCETKNLEFFTSRGISVAAQRIHTQVAQGQLLVKNEEIRKGMLAAQRRIAKPEAAKNIYELLLKICEEKEDSHIAAD